MKILSVNEYDNTMVVEWEDGTRLNHRLPSIAIQNDRVQLEAYLERERPYQHPVSKTLADMVEPFETIPEPVEESTEVDTNDTDGELTWTI